MRDHGRMADAATTGRPWRGESPERRDAARRERLLAAGLELFGTRGYLDTSVEAICSEAQVSGRSFYEHFSNREDLLIAVYEQALAGVARALDEALAAAPLDVDAMCRAGIEAPARALVGDERAVRVNFVEVIGVSDRVQAHRREVLSEMGGIIERHAQRLVDAGAIARVPSRWTQVAFIGAFESVLVEWLAEGDDSALENAIEDLARLFGATLRQD